MSADLDGTPMILPEGAGSQLLYMRTIIAALVAQRDELVAQIEELNEQVEVLSNLVRTRDEELTRTSAEARSAALRVQPPRDDLGQAARAGALRKL